MITQRSLSVCAATLLASVTLSFITLPAQAAINVVAYWHLGEKDPGAMNNAVMSSSTDSAGNQTLTTVGSPHYSSTVASNAVTATGSGLCFESSGYGYGTSALFSGLTDNFGIELWVKPASTNGYKCLVSNGSSYDGNGLGLFQIGDTYQGYFSGAGYVGSASATVGTWVHLALVRNKGVTTLFTNGVAAGATSALTPESPTGSFNLGAFEGGSVFSGSLDEVRVFIFPAGQFNIANLLVFAKGSLAISLNGAASLTNECHTEFTDPGATATGAPLAIAAGEFHGLTLKGDGTAAAWGYNDYGETNIPEGLSNVVAVAGGGFHSLALKSDGTVAAWGFNAYGQTTIPVDLSNVVAIAAGRFDSLALKGDGTVVAWGDNYADQTTIPVGLSNVVTIAAGFYHNLALKSDGTVVAWGYNFYIPEGLSNVVAIAGGDSHSLALKSDGTVVAWEHNSSDQTTIPVGVSNVVAIAAGGYHNLALKSDGTVVAWGSNDYGQTDVPVGLSNVVAIAGGYAYNLALKSDGTVVAWGRNDNGQTTIPVDLSILAVTVSGSVDANEPGIYLLNYTVTNSLSSATASRTVIVQDTTPPVLTLIGSNPVTNAVNVEFVDLGVYLMDTCSQGGAYSVYSTVNVSMPGSYTVTYIAYDGSGNTATNIRTVIVADTNTRSSPTLTNPVTLGNGAFRFSFTSTPNALPTVWASTNLMLPLNVWSNLGSVVETPIGSGQFQFTDPQATNNPRRFYRVRLE